MQFKHNSLTWQDLGAIAILPSSKIRLETSLKYQASDWLKLRPVFKWTNQKLQLWDWSPDTHFMILGPEIAPNLLFTCFFKHKNETFSTNCQTTKKRKGNFNRRVKYTEVLPRQCTYPDSTNNRCKIYINSYCFIHAITRNKTFVQGKKQYCLCLFIQYVHRQSLNQTKSQNIWQWK